MKNSALPQWRPYRHVGFWQEVLPILINDTRASVLEFDNSLITPPLHIVAIFVKLPPWNTKSTGHFTKSTAKMN